MDSPRILSAQMYVARGRLPAAQIFGLCAA